MTGVQTCALPIYLVAGNDQIVTGGHELYAGVKIFNFGIENVEKCSLSNVLFFAHAFQSQPVGFNLNLV